MYSVPTEYLVRIHHIRPRFKSNIENVLLYMASEICNIGREDTSEFSNKLREVIRLFPGNALRETKTLNNWRTEITSLLGLIEFNEDGTCNPSRMSEILTEKQDLIEFFRFFCYKFQYPGGHLKPKKTLDFINQGVKFKPVKYILKVFLEGKKESEGRIGLTKGEVTHCMFNDLRVVRDNQDPSKTLKLIMRNRNNDIEYDCDGDVVRYAGDILDYMELANLVVLRPDGKYYVKTHEIEVINSFIEDENYFTPYDDLYDSKITLEDIKNTQIEWFRYVNTNLNETLFESDILQVLDDHDELIENQNSDFIDSVLLSIRRRQEGEETIKTKVIGDVGESIAILHEQIRLESIGRRDLSKKVRKIPEIYSVGYDIKSYEGIAELQKFIEVKTTISKNKININRFHMTPNEWGSADTSRDKYYIYRLMISSKDVTLFVIEDPVGKYKNDKLAMVPRNGVDITYSENSGCFEEVLTQ
jgi:hypothetical protein